VTTAAETGPGPASALAAWSDRTRRDLPWRRTRDPWAVLVSEAMLQQTQVARVVVPWARFLGRFPDPCATASAPAGEVIGLWAGLGYNRRAVQLHAAATRICGRHGGRVPDRLEDLLALPGVGPYTARAVLAFAFERDVGVVDTNAARVLARAVSGRPLRAAEVQRLADDLVPAGGGWAHNQAMLDLGATVCTKRRPRRTWRRGDTRRSRAVRRRIRPSVRRGHRAGSRPSTVRTVRAAVAWCRPCGPDPSA
jgi:A/G-specific adenine glycosylase